MPSLFMLLVSWFYGFFNQATTDTPKLIVTQNTSDDVVRGKEVPFMPFINIYAISSHLNFRKSANRF